MDIFAYAKSKLYWLLVKILKNCTWFLSSGVSIFSWTFFIRGLLQKRMLGTGVLGNRVLFHDVTGPPRRLQTDNVSVLYPGRNEKEGGITHEDLLFTNPVVYGPLPKLLKLLNRYFFSRVFLVRDMFTKQFCKTSKELDTFRFSEVSKLKSDFRFICTLIIAQFLSAYIVGCLFR